MLQSAGYELKVVDMVHQWRNGEGVMSLFFRIVDILLMSINKNIAVVGLVLGVFIVAFNVVLRTLAGFGWNVFSLTWGEEIARYCFIWSALFGATYGFRNGVHISVMIMVESVSPRVGKVIMMFSYVLVSLYLAFMAWAGYMTCVLNYELGFKLESFHDVHLWYFLLCLPFSFLGATYRALEKLYETYHMSFERMQEKHRDFNL